MSMRNELVEAVPANSAVTSLAHCRVCGSAATVPSRRFRAPGLSHCPECDADSYGPPIDDSLLYTQAYFEGDEYFSYLEDEAVHRLNADRKIGRLLRHSPAPRVVVEIGCAYGFFLRRVAQRFPGTVCIGIDVNAEVLQAARGRGGDNIHYFVASDVDKFLAFAKQRGVDWLVAWDTFEHLPSADVLLRYVRDLATADTVCAMTTIDAGGIVPRLRGKNWRQFHPPTHIIYPTRKTFAFLALRHGWSILAHETFGYYRAARQYLAIASKLLPKSLRASYRTLLMKGLFGTGLFLNLHDIDLIVFRFTPKEVHE